MFNVIPGDKIFKNLFSSLSSETKKKTFDYVSDTVKNTKRVLSISSGGYSEGSLKSRREPFDIIGGGCFGNPIESHF
jgi:hypothetical protein